MTESRIAVAFARLRAFAADAHILATLMAEAGAPAAPDTATAVAAYGKLKTKSQRGMACSRIMPAEQ